MVPQFGLSLQWQAFLHYVVNACVLGLTNRLVGDILGAVTGS